MGVVVFFFKQKTEYEIGVWLEFRRVLFRAEIAIGDSQLGGSRGGRVRVYIGRVVCGKSIGYSHRR